MRNDVRFSAMTSASALVQLSWFGSSHVGSFFVGAVRAARHSALACLPRVPCSVRILHLSAPHVSLVFAVLRNISPESPLSGCLIRHPATARYLRPLVARHPTSAAKNHTGKVLYGNMYSEIKAGTTCNTLVTEYILRKNPRGGAEIDTEVSPFLRERLRDKLPSKANRRRRQTCPAEVAVDPTAAAAGAKAAPIPPTGTEISQPSSGWDSGTTTVQAPASESSAHGAKNITDTVGSAGEAETAEIDAHGQDGQTHKTNSKMREDWGNPEGCGDSGSRSVGEKHDCSVGNRSETSERRLPRRPRYKAPVRSGSAVKNSSGEGAPHDSPPSQGDRFCGGPRGKGECHGRGGGSLNARSGDSSGRKGGQRRGREKQEHGVYGGGGEGRSVERRKRVVTSASLTTLSLRDMERREERSASEGSGGDALDT